MRFLLPAFAAQPLQAAAARDKVADRFTPAPYAGQRMEGLLGDRMRVNLEGRLLHVDEKGILKGFQRRRGERLKTLMDRVVRSLLPTQLPDGYLGTYLDDKRWTSSDVWVHKYALIGLISYYQATGYEPALAASRKIGDLLCRTFGTGPGQRDIIASGTHVGMAATSVLEPMVNLYRATGDPKYLDFCEYLVRSWNQPNGPKIIDSLLATQSVFRTANAKAYEMMSNLVGLAALYRVTGNPVYLETAQTAWKDIAARRLYVTGTTSAQEHFADDSVLPGEEASSVGEGCATVTWLQLTWQLLRLTGEPQYAEQLEDTVYNALLGALAPRTGDICYFTPLDVKTLYPAEGSAALTVNPAKAARFPLYLRVPAWTARFAATAGGRTYPGVAGQFLAIERDWKPGDQVTVDMDMTVRVLPGGPSYPYNVAIARGPQVLALEQAVNPGVLDLQAAGPRVAEVKLSDAIIRLPRTWRGNQAYVMEGVVAGKPRELTLVPFTDARTYRVWLLKP